jgi:hypothetical protein
MGGLASIPDKFDFDLTGGIRIDPTSKLATEMRIAPDSKLTTELVLRGEAGQPIALHVDPLGVSVTGDRDHPVSVSAQAELLNLPRLTYDQIVGLIRTVMTPKLRVQFPQNMRFGISVFPLTLFGVDALSFRVCGEGQFIVGEYVPNRYERCEEDCLPECDPPPDCC